MGKLDIGNRDPTSQTLLACSRLPGVQVVDRGVQMVRSESNHTRGKWGGKHGKLGRALVSPQFCFVLFLFLFFLINLACKQALLFGQAKRASRERPGSLAASLAQIEELARRLSSILRPLSKICDAWNRLTHSNQTVYSSNGLDDVWVSCNAG